MTTENVNISEGVPISSSKYICTYPMPYAYYRSMFLYIQYVCNFFSLMVLWVNKIYCTDTVLFKLSYSIQYITYYSTYTIHTVHTVIILHTLIKRYTYIEKKLRIHLQYIHMLLLQYMYIHTVNNILYILIKNISKIYCMLSNRTSRLSVWRMHCCFKVNNVIA
jgi:hypothetical protein